MTNHREDINMKVFILLLFSMCFSANARFGGAFDWAEHEKADCIFIVKMKSWEATIKEDMDKKEGVIKIRCDVVATLKGEEKDTIEVSFNAINAVVDSLIFDSGNPTPGKYYFVFLRYVNSVLMPLETNFSFLTLPKYFQLNSKLSPKDAMLFELTQCLEDKDVEVVIAGLACCDRFAILPPPALLAKLTKHQDQRVKGLALQLLLQQKDPSAIASFEDMLCSKFENSGISGEMLYKLLDTMKMQSNIMMQPSLFSTKACNSLATSQDAKLQEAGIYMLRNNADISSIPVLLSAIDAESEQTQYDAYYALVALTHAKGGVILSFKDFCLKKKDIVKEWKDWGKNDSQKFLENPINAKKNSKINLGIDIQN